MKVTYRCKLSIRRKDVGNNDDSNKRSPEIFSVQGQNLQPHFERRDGKQNEVFYGQ